MAVGTHDEEVDALLFHRGGDHFFGGTGRGPTGDFVADGAQFGGGLLQVITGLVVDFTGAEEMAVQAFEQRVFAGVGDGPEHAGAAVVGEEEPRMSLKAREATRTG